MKTLLVMTVGQTDVQLVIDDQRHKFSGNTCGTLLDAVSERKWSLVNSPHARSRDLIRTLPDGDLLLCAPKLDAVLTYLDTTPPTSVLIFETTRESERDPRLAGKFLEHQLRERGVTEVIRVAFLTGTEQLEDPSNGVDAVVRRSVVDRLSDAISKQVEPLTKNDEVFVAATGGLAAANELISEMVRLHAVGGPTVTALEVPDRERVQGEDRAIEEKFYPAAGFRARWHALSLIEKGNLLGAWGAVSHLEDEPGQNWTQVIKWLAHFASSLPLPADCDLVVLSHERMAVRAALRVELALRAGDIPRAVHGTVAFFEAALWDGLYERLERSSEPKKRRYFKVVKGNAPSGDKLLRAKDAKDNPSRPFHVKETIDGIDWYWVSDGDGGPGARIAEHFLARTALTAFVKVLATKNKCDENFYSLRNDVAHNEPTPQLMNEARDKMVAAELWSGDGRFLMQPLVKNVLEELGVQGPEKLWDDLFLTVQTRLRAP